MKKGILIAVGVVVLAGTLMSGRFFHTGTPLNAVPTVGVSAPSSAGDFAEPITDAIKRVTKKPFGLYVSLANSPVSPERFTGYHTGVDFETFAGEQDSDVPLYAICTGQLLQKRTASGYGGLLVQSCTLDGQPITVVYGHIKLTSISAVIGQRVESGQKLGVLGKGYGAETDGERKHLHLGIHRGATPNILGYVQAKADLSAWINIADYLR